jgi:hypothetical protein
MGFSTCSWAGGIAYLLSCDLGLIKERRERHRTETERGLRPLLPSAAMAAAIALWGSAVTVISGTIFKPKGTGRERSGWG